MVVIGITKIDETSSQKLMTSWWSSEQSSLGVAYRLAQWIDHGHGLIPPGESADAHPEHPLYHRTLVVTGALMSMTRYEAWEQVSLVGGFPSRV